MSTVAPGLVAGTWTIDPVHSEIGFVVRHVMVSKVRGRFTKFSGTITVAEDHLSSSVEASIEAGSITTNDDNRDNDLRSSAFLAVDEHPIWTFKSTSVTQKGSDFVVTGDLTVRGVTRPVQLDLEFNGVSPDPWGGTRAGFTATTEIDRKDFGVETNIPLDGGGVVIGDRVQITMDIEAVLQQG